jgi:Glyoxalase/Bleomycin resistance protein/Dioxygenase superfamily/Pentapeptide repeats (8 copies)
VLKGVKMAGQGPINVKTANMTGSSFIDVNLGRAIFNDVNLSDSVFENVALGGVRIHDANMTNLTIDHARLDGMRINGILVTDLLTAYRAQSSKPAAHSLQVTEIKAFVPSKDFARSQQFYKDIGFHMASSGGGIAYFHVEHASFLLQDFYAEGCADNFMMHLLVKDVAAWWQHIHDAQVVETYGVTLSQIEMQPWRMKDFCLTDPSGVLWRIGQNVD